MPSAAPSIRLTSAVAGLSLLLTGFLAGCGKSSSGTGTASASTSAPVTASAAATSSATSSSSASNESGTPDPCSLLTTAEASSYLGGPATHGAAKAEFRGVTCEWTAGSSFISVADYKGREFYSPKQQAPDATPLPGVGDEAFVSQALAGARKGDIVVIIGGYGASAHFADALKAAIARV